VKITALLNQTHFSILPVVKMDRVYKPAHHTPKFIKGENLTMSKNGILTHIKKSKVNKDNRKIE
jgi:hypothetical protein